MSSCLTFLHAADIHLGRPFSGLAKCRPELAELVRTAGYTAWDRIVTTALAQQVDFATIAGDLFDSPNPSVRARVAFRDGVLRLHRAGIPLFLALGNHDPLTGFPDSLKSLPGLNLYGPEPSGVRLRLPGTDCRVDIYGVSFETPVVGENLVRKFRRDPDAEIAVGVVHSNVSGVGGHLDYAPCTLDDLKLAGMDVWCLGHVHSPLVLCGDPLVIYPGTSQGAHINESGPRGCNLVTVAPGGSASTLFVPLSPILWSEMSVDVSHARGIEEIVELTEATFLEAAAWPDGTQAVVARIILDGTDTSGNPNSLADVEEFTEILGERLSVLPVPVVPESVRDERAMPTDRISLLEEGGFLSDFLTVSAAVGKDTRQLEGIMDDVGAELLKRVGSLHLAPELDPRRLRVDGLATRALLKEAEEQIVRICLHRSRA